MVPFILEVLKVWLVIHVPLFALTLVDRAAFQSHAGNIHL